METVGRREFIVFILKLYDSCGYISFNLRVEMSTVLSRFDEFRSHFLSVRFIKYHQFLSATHALGLSFLMED